MKKQNFEGNIIVGNRGGTMSPAKWKELMRYLEDNGYLWMSGAKPTEVNKCPSEFYRQLRILENKTIAVQEYKIEPAEMFIEVNVFLKESKLQNETTR